MSPEADDNGAAEAEEPERRDTQEDGDDEAPSLVDKRAAAPKEAENAVLQARHVRSVVIDYLNRASDGPGHRFLLDSTLLQTLNKLAVQGLIQRPGEWRTQPVKLGGNSKHTPSPWEEVPDLVGQICYYVNTNWDRSGLHLASYLLWRLNWVHPWLDGNGRTSRAIAYLVLCIKAGRLLPGESPLPKRIDENRADYYDALDVADAACRRGEIDVSKMETMVANRLAEQLEKLPEKAETVDAVAAERRHTAIENLSTPEDRAARTQIRAAWIAFWGAVVVAAIGGLTTVIVKVTNSAPDPTKRCLPNGYLGECYCGDLQSKGFSVCSEDGVTAVCNCPAKSPSPPAKSPSPPAKPLSPPADPPTPP